MRFFHFFARQKQKKNGFFISMILVPLILMVSGCIGPKNQGVSNNQIVGKIQQKSNVLPAIWVGFVGTSKTDPDVIALRQLLALKNVHGIILFDRNIKNPDQLRSLVSFLTQNNPNIPVAIDQEGGKIARLKAHKGFVACDAMRAAADYRGNVQEIVTIAQAADLEMRNVGITVVFGPVADTNINPHCPIIGALGRSFSDQSEQVIRCCNAVIVAYATQGVMACLKHAPGHGSSSSDSHKGLTDVTFTWRNQELDPFIQCFKAHPKTAIMMSHVMLCTLDPKYPASMSKTIVDFLRKEMLRSGISQKPLLISDAYDMKAICYFYTPRQFLKQCGAAGLDVVLFYCDNQYIKTFPSLVGFLKQELGIAV